MFFTGLPPCADNSILFCPNPLGDDATAPARGALHITGFVDHDLDVYLATLPLGSAP